MRFICHFILSYSANLVDSGWVSGLILIFQILVQNAKKNFFFLLVKDILLRFWVGTVTISFFFKIKKAYCCGFG